MRVCDDFDPNGILINMRHLVDLKRCDRNPGYIYRSLMVDIYEEYQRSHDWRALVVKVKERDGNRCRECGREVEKHGVVHHRSYDHWGMADEVEMRDCVFVCKGCHNHIHKATEIDVPFWAMTNPQDVYITDAQRSVMYSHFIGGPSPIVPEPPIVPEVKVKGMRQCYNCKKHHPKGHGGRVKAGVWVCLDCQRGKSGTPYHPTSLVFKQGATP